MNKILETERLLLREFKQTDAGFVLTLLNSPNWLKFIGDKKVKNLDDAKHYISSHLIESYKANGYGLWLVALKETNAPIGMCGIVNREQLEHPDIGFAFLPEYERNGYGFESANAVLNYAVYKLRLGYLLAITDVQNYASISLLAKLKFHFKQSKIVSGNNNVLVFSSEKKLAEINEIDELTKAFFNAFTNAGHQIPNLKSLRTLLVPEAKIINNSSDTVEIYSVDEFIAPRQKMLTNGTLTDFREHEISNNTTQFDTIASRTSLYRKQGVLNGLPFETMGQKLFHYTKIDAKWKIASVVWCDEPSNQISIEK